MSLSPSAEIYDNYTGDKNHRNDLYNELMGYERDQGIRKASMCGGGGSKNSSQKTGGFLGLFENSGIGKYLTEAKKSERALVRSHQKMSNTIAEWTKTYDKHLANLGKLDEFMSTGDSLQSVFKDILMKNYFKKFGEKIDTSIPLFLDNYIADKDSTPNDFKREHVQKQIWYVLHTEFGPVDSGLIKFIQINILSDSKVQAVFRTVENKVHERTFDHKNLNLNISKVREEVAEILKTAKGDMSFNINEVKEKKKEGVPSLMISPDMGNNALKNYLGVYGINLTQKNIGNRKSRHNATLYTNATKKMYSNGNGKGVNVENKKPGELAPHEKDFNPTFGLLDKAKANAIAKKEAEEKAKAAIAGPTPVVPDITSQAFPGMPPTTQTPTSAPTPSGVQLPTSLQNAKNEIKSTQFGPPPGEGITSQLEPKPFPIISNDFQQKLTPSVIPIAPAAVAPIIQPASPMCFTYSKNKEECNKLVGQCYFDEKEKRCRHESTRK